MDDTTRKEVCRQLAHYLADTYVLYVKTQNFHWNMVGSEFFMYHKLLEEQYESLADANDELAERIRQLKEKAPGSMEQFLELSEIKEASSNLSQQKMIQELANNHSHMVEKGEELIAYCDQNGDPATSDMIVGRIREHGKQAWLLRSHLDG